jgi:hypothetical protein
MRTSDEQKDYYLQRKENGEKQIGVWVSKETYEDLIAACKDTERTVSGYARWALKQALKRHNNG